MPNRKPYQKKSEHERGANRGHNVCFRDLDWQEMIEEAEERNISISEYLATLHKESQKKKN